MERSAVDVDKTITNYTDVVYVTWGTEIGRDTGNSGGFRGSKDKP